MKRERKGSMEVIMAMRVGKPHQSGFGQDPVYGANIAPGQRCNLSRMSAACLSCANTASSMAEAEVSVCLARLSSFPG